MGVHQSQYILFYPSNNHIFTSEKTDSENQTSCFKIYSQEVEEPYKTIADSKAHALSIIANTSLQLTSLLQLVIVSVK